MKPPGQKRRNKANAAQNPLQAGSNGNAGGPVKAGGVSNRFSAKFMVRYFRLLVLTGPATILITASIVAVWPGVVAQLGFQPFVDYLMFESQLEGYKNLLLLGDPGFTDYFFTIHAQNILVGVPVITFTVFFTVLYMAIPRRHHAEALEQLKFFDKLTLQRVPLGDPYTWFSYVCVIIFVPIFMAVQWNTAEFFGSSTRSLPANGVGIASYIFFTMLMPALASLLIYFPHMLVTRKIIEGPNTKRGKSRDK